MLGFLHEYLYSEPERLTKPGRLLARLGAFLILAGAIGRLSTITINVLPALANQPQTSKALADIYPTLPLWWVPESWLGLAVSMSLIAIGICLTLHGREVDHMLREI